MQRLRALIRRFGPDQKGVQTVELALLLPVLFLITFGIIDFGRAYFSWVIVTNGAREGARSAAVGQTPAAVVTTVQGALSGLNVTSLQTGTCTTVTEGALCVNTTNAGGAPGAPVVVLVRYNFSFMILPNIASWANGPALPGGVFPLTAQATMRLE